MCAHPSCVAHARTAAAAATKADIAFRLLHDASVVVGKEQAVLLPALNKVRCLRLADAWGA
jgi:hypothetical protein